MRSSFCEEWLSAPPAATASDCVYQSPVIAIVRTPYFDHLYPLVVMVRTADCDYQYPGFAVIRPSYRDHLYPTVTSSASYCDYQYPQFMRVYQPYAFRSARGFFARHRPAASPCSSCRAAPSSTIGVCLSPRVSSAVSARFVLAGISCREAPRIAGRVHLNSDDTKLWADWQSAASTYQRSFLLNGPSASAGAERA
jgi:hypothetical protein